MTDVVVMDEGGMAQLEARVGRLVGRVVDDVADDARRFVAVDTGDLRSTIRADHDGRALSGRVWCGDLGRGVDYWAAVEYGSRPHIIRPRSKRALYWPGADHPVAVVHHPGTRAQPFMRPAVYRRRAYGDLA